MAVATYTKSGSKATTAATLDKKVFGLKDHAKGAMIEWRYRFEPSIQHNALKELITHALHR